MPARQRSPVGFCRHGARVGALQRSRENALFCQRPVQKVEPILTPKGLVEINKGRRAEDLPLDRFLRQRIVAFGDVCARRRNVLL